MLTILDDEGSRLLGAAVVNAHFQNVGGELLGAFELPRHIAIEQYQRMEVTVTGVKHIGAAQLVLDRELGRAL